jgi:SOS-response transcriptional repressor LexA/transcriptional regulator with XRE-family HTH domain
MNDCPTLQAFFINLFHLLTFASIINVQVLMNVKEGVIDLNSLEFGKYLKSLRKKNKLSMRQLEALSGVSNSYISQIESGERGIPKVGILRKLHKPLEVTYEELMERAGYASTQEIISKYLDNVSGNMKFKDIGIHTPEDYIDFVISNFIEAAVSCYLLNKPDETVELFKNCGFDVALDEGNFTGGLYEASLKIIPCLDLAEKEELFDIISEHKEGEDYNIPVMKFKLIPQNKPLSNYMREKQLTHSNINEFKRMIDIPKGAYGVPILTQEQLISGNLRLEQPTGYELIDVNKIKIENSFALRINDDSMIGEHICEEDVVVITLIDEVSPKDIAIVSINGNNAVLRKISFQDDLCLVSSANIKIETILVPSKDVRIIGKVIEVRRSLN